VETWTYAGKLSALLGSVKSAAFTY
jgi:hypothetical protein